jgi:capsular polysaccharide transport system ATP-binding protein
VIHFDGVSLFTREGWVKRHILSDVSLDIPADKRIAFLGGAAPDRSVIMNLISGVLIPTRGRVVRGATVSFPNTLQGAFDGAISLIANIDYISALYDLSPGVLKSEIDRIVDFGEDYKRPFRELPRDIRLQLGQLIALTIPFDLYVINGPFNGGPKPLRDAANALIEDRGKSSGIILNTRDLRIAERQCDMALVLLDKSLVLFDTVQAAKAHLQRTEPL